LLWPLCYKACAALGRGLRHILDDPAFFKPTIIPAIPSLAVALLLHKAINKEAKTILVGAGPLPKMALAGFKESHLRLALGYGLTETSSGVAISVDSADPYAMDFCPGNDFRIESDGSIDIKSEALMKGYLNNREATAEAIKDGWLLTNDLGFIDKDNKLHVIGRKDDILILANGTKFDCNEAEEKLLPMLAGLDFAIRKNKEELEIVYFSHDPKTREKVEKALAFFNSQQPLFAKISLVKPQDTPLARTRTGKIIRHLL
jgi:long-subunit acyl-CoA synthetase (AMP-forming)